MLAIYPMSFSRRQFLKRAALTTVGGAAGVGFYAWQVAPHWIETTHMKMPLAGLPPNWQGKRLVQISDIHVGPDIDYRYLQWALEKTLALQPDLLAITGDFMTCVYGEQVDAAVKLIERLNPQQQPIIVTLGNHDYGSPYRSSVATNLLDRLAMIGCIPLRNSSTVIDGLSIAGTDDLWSGRLRFDATLAEVDTSRDSILLTHNPDAVDDFGNEQFRGWILSGHTHGGQCRFPCLGAPIVPIKNRRYTRGLIDLGSGRTLYVNRGLGYKRQVRFGCAPEITVFELQPGVV